MKMNKFIFLALLPALVGCNQNSGDTTITDMLGREVSFNKDQVNRVVCIGAGALRYYSYMCDVSKLVGVEEIEWETSFGIGQAVRPYYTANVDTFKSLPSIGRGGPRSALDPTKILETNPDIVISFNDSVEVNDNLQTQLGGIPVVALKQGKNGVFDDTTLKSFKLLSDIFNRGERYQELTNYINACKQEFNNLTPTTETYYEGCIGNWGATAITGTFFQFPVLTFAKVTNPVDSLGRFDKPGQVTIELEELTDMEPDYILIDSTGVDSFIDEYNAEPSKYNGLDALTNGHALCTLPYNAYFTNLEIQIISTYYVASIAHPEAFDGFDFEAKADEVLTKFVGKAIYNELKAHPYAHGGYGVIDFGE